MEVRHIPRSRSETRGLVLEFILREKSTIRAKIAREIWLTDASVSRIVGDLQAEGILVRRQGDATYVGGSKNIIALSNEVKVAGIELSNNRLSFGLGGLDGSVQFVERLVSQDRHSQGSFEKMVGDSLLPEVRNAGEIRQIAVSIPGYRRSAFNPIYDWDMERMDGFLREAFGEIPFVVTNSIIAQAAFNKYSMASSYPVSDDHLFLFVGHGVAGVSIGSHSAKEAFMPKEIGHMVVLRGGPLCRCGNRGCVEAFTSLSAVSEIIGKPESEIIEFGDSFFDALALDSSMRIELRNRLTILGIAIGNALNLQPSKKVVVSGWPSLLKADDRAAIGEGISESLLGGYREDALELFFFPPAIGNDPRAALSFARYKYLREGAVGVAAEANRKQRVSA